MMGNKDQAGRTCATPQGEAECEHWSRLATTSILRAGPTSFASAPQSFFGNNQVTIFNYLNQCPPLSFSLFPAQPKGWSLQLATRSRIKVLSLLSCAGRRPAFEPKRPLPFRKLAALFGFPVSPSFSFSRPLGPYFLFRVTCCFARLSFRKLQRLCCPVLSCLPACRLATRTATGAYPPLSLACNAP